MTIFRENILEIVENWGADLSTGDPPPLELPCSHVDGQGIPIPGIKPAINAGTIELKCFINNVCPFYKSGYREDGLVFNEDTYKRIQPWLPDTLAGALTVTPGVAGMHFRPRLVFRHNYIYHKVSDGGTAGESETDIDPNADLFTNFNDDYVEITELGATNSNSVPGVDETRYKAEQSWIVVKSIFDPICTRTGTAECDDQAQWGYKGQKVSDTGMKDRDLRYDYNLKYYNEYDDSWEKVNGKWRLKAGERLRIDKNRAQMPVQERVLSTENAGVHWRLIKRTPLFQGEDFFIRFYKQANDTVSDPNSTDVKDGIEPFPEEFSRYFSLDVTRDDKLNIDVNNAGADAVMRKRNFAVCPPTIGNEKPDDKSFDFHDQAYYIIELGMGTLYDRYFIIITERANPIFVNLVPTVPIASGVEDLVSKKFSEFTKISGGQLIRANSFDMIVRNHLGSIVIQFSGEGINVPPWVIKRWDWVPEIDPISQEPFLKDKVRTMFIPRGRMAIMGGNIRSGFLFGPLQYSTKYVSIIYPPREEIMEGEDDMRLAFGALAPEEIIASETAGAFKSNPFFLPTEGEHDIMFSSTDIFLQDLGKNVIPVGEAIVNQPLFVQDAQYYSNYYESDDPTNNGGYRIGGFFYDETVKDFSEVEGGRTSNLKVKKYRFINDPKTKQQAFDILIGMMAGDHIFILGVQSSISPPALPPSQRLGSILFSSVPNNHWYLESCKTPIMTSLRLISHESEETRWSDGSFAELGINKSPLEGISPYFLDATDHVMSFSDSWSANGFSEMEHTGSINFYLNRGMPVPNNVTDELMSLQNKTFYIEIWAGYTRPCPDGDNSYSRQNDFFKLFTGLCHGGGIDYQYGKNVMSCKIEDYTAVLKGSRFFNSPWFDGVKDINCIREIMQMCGFRDAGKYDPGNLIKFLSENSTSNSPNTFFHNFDGRLFKMDAYALPSGYNRLDQPAFKFNDGDPYMDAVLKIAKRAGKVFYFDQFGLAHYENFQDIMQSDFLGSVPLKPLYYFTTNPELHGGQLIFNKLERDYDVAGIINHIKVMSNTPDFYLLIGDQLNWSSMEDPGSEGFIGYLKSSYQQESMFGSKEALMASIRKYSVAFRPKIKAKFETYGVPLRANDIVSINGENTRVIKVSNNIVAEKNEWWMEVETEKYQIIQASNTIP